MITISIIGSGNVAEALAMAVAANSDRLALCQIIARNSCRRVEIATMAGCDEAPLEHFKAADLYIIAVSDSAVESVVKGLNYPAGAKVAHCAGSVAMGSADGVLYPMQTLTAGRRVNMREVALFVEGDPIIELVARILSDRVLEIDSNKRRQLHLAAVFACNFTNAMLSATEQVLEGSGADLSLYESLVRETIDKAFESSPRAAQTGAARRGDEVIQSNHKEMLEGDLKQIYQIISKYIWETSKRI